ncbi:HWE histidine kinase domain-containing protein [Falsirhodobacter xinxiangensis]|uniref:HWE histidine kinase domain-containing protein n=1 Tax=Falsirhodobacter xinxiangensis TaxID=2530049 RepID=UPI0010AB0066|nr:HWE histidine kinase domain-containing protein [Rhodobacter xinxiangensis]
MTEPVTLSNCDQEPIHIPGATQPHGALLAFDSTLDSLLRHSANAAEILGTPVATGLDAGAIIGPTIREAALSALEVTDSDRRPALIFDLQLPSGIAADIAVHVSGSTIVVEIEPARRSGTVPLQTTRLLIDRITGIDRVETLAPEVARLMRRTLGYDRVMVYEFARDGSGKVLAEEKADHLESFLGQHFPASDIPAQARALYLRNTIRLISDASGARIPLVPELLDGRPLDMSQAHLRAVSPIHCEYLRNMGVSASMSVSIIVDGALWGLIACHHYAPRILSMAERVAAEMFGEFLSLHLGTILRKRKLDNAAAIRTQLDRLSRLTEVEDLGAMIRDNLSGFMSMIQCDGIAVLMENELQTQGLTPAEDDVRSLARSIAQRANGNVWASESLVRTFPQAEAFHTRAAGVLALPLSQLPRDWLLFFRREQVHTLNWAGNPDKTYDTGPLGDRLTPRKSFAIWKEEVHRRSAPWTDDDFGTANALRTAIVEIVLLHNELLAEERSKADLRQRVLNDELNHRVKNILAVIKSVIGQPVEQGRTLESYVSALKGRIQALSFAHDQVMRGDGGGSLQGLLQAELSPYAGSARLHLDGPEALLDSRGFSVMAQVLHEMATNAAKYGALSRAGAQLSVTWGPTPEGDCRLAWRESGGPPVVPPSRSGFGSLLLERSLPFDLGGSSRIDYLPSGVEADFILPARHVRFDSGPTPLAEKTVTTDTKRLPETAHLLLLEDQLLIAMDVEAMLQESGFTRISLARNVEQALAIIDQGVELAMLDVNLGRETSVPVAEELHRRGIPFVFATGYDERSALPEGLRHVPVVRKPYEVENLLEALARAYG